jgi:parallel beta-helix repeat protein
MTRRKKVSCKRSEKWLLGLFVLLAATLLIGLSGSEESVLSFESLSFGNGITGAAIGLQSEIEEIAGSESIIVAQDTPSIEIQGIIGIEAESDEITGWNKTFDGVGYSDRIYSIVTDSEDNVYAAGYGSRFFGSLSQTDWWIKKFDSSGTEDIVNWNYTFNDPNDGLDHIEEIALDSQGNLFAVGIASRMGGSGSGADWHLKKFNSSGSENLTHWNYNYTGAGAVNVQAYGITIDSNDSVYVVGTHPSGGWLIKKFYDNGTQDITNWNLSFTSGENVPYDIEVDSNDNLYVVGYGTNLVGGSSSSDWLIKKFNSSGAEDLTNWNLTFDNGNGVDIAYAITIDSNDNLYVVGYGTNLIDGSSDSDWLIKKFNSSGYEYTTEEGWNRSYDAAGDHDYARDVIVDGNNNVYVAGDGYDAGSVTADSNWWMKKFNSTGTEDTTWNLTFDGNNQTDYANALAVDSSDNIYLGGLGNDLISGSSVYDWWIKKFEGDPVPNAACGNTISSSLNLNTDLDCTGHGLVVGASNIVIDCGNRYISGDLGTGDYGITITAYNNVTVKNCNLTNFGRAIYASGGTQEALVFDNSIEGVVYGIRLDNADYSNISHNNFSGTFTSDAVYFDTSADNNNFWGNIFDDDDGFYESNQADQIFCVNGYGNLYGSTVRVESDDKGVPESDCGPTPNGTIYVNESLTSRIIDWGGNATYVPDFGTALRSANKTVVLLTNDTLTNFYSGAGYYGAYTTNDNVEINCQGFTLRPTVAGDNNQLGIQVFDSNINIHDCYFEDFDYSIYSNIVGTQANISNNNFVANTGVQYAIRLNDGDDWNINHNNFSGSFSSDAVYINTNADNNNFWGNIFDDDKGFYELNQADQNFCVNGYGNLYGSTVRVESDGKGVPEDDCGPTPNGTIYVNESLTSRIIDWGGNATYVPDFGTALRSANQSVVMLTNDTLTNFYSLDYYGAYTTGDNVEVDCQGFTLRPSSAGNNNQLGIQVLDSNINIHDCYFEDFDYGVYSNIADTQANISNNNFVANTGVQYGIRLNDGDNWNINHNNFSGSFGSDAVYINTNADNNNFWGNIFDDDKGFYENNQADQNFCVNGYGNLYGSSMRQTTGDHGVPPADCGPAPTGTIYVNDSASREINWGVNATLTSVISALHSANKTIEVVEGSGPYAGGSMTVRNNVVLECNGATLQGSGSDEGIYIYDEDFLTINNCTFDNFDYGIRMDYGENNVISNSTFVGNDNYAIYVYYGSNYNTIKSNNMSSNGDYAMRFDSSTGSNQVLNNNVTLNHVESNPDYAIHLDANAQNNLIYKNNFISNKGGAIQGYSESSTNEFNLSTQGNYWDDFDSVGEGCSDVGVDGICDDSYNLTGDTSKDFYASTSQLSLLEVSNNAPNTISVILNATSANNVTTDNLTCYTNITDADGGNVYANYTWYNNSVAYLSGQSGAFTSGTLFNIANLTSGNTTTGENWTCSVNAYDGTDYETDWNNASLVVVNICGMITSSVTLTNDVTSTGTCFNINASNVVLDCAGYTINYSNSGGADEVGVYINNFNNLTIQNCGFVLGNATTEEQPAIYFLNSYNGTVINNTISTTGDSSYGLRLHFSSLTIQNNTISTTGDFAYGVFVRDDTTATIQNNTISTAGEYGYGIYLNSASNSTIQNNVVTTTGDIGPGMYFSESSNSTIQNNIINVSGSSSSAFEFYKDSNNNLFQNNNITQSGNDVIVLDATLTNFPENNNFTNNTFSNIARYDLNILDEGINGTYLIDQVITNYSIAGAGSLIYFKDTDEGEIKYLELINGTSANLSADVQINNNSIYVNSTNNIGLNKSAQLELYNLSYVSTPQLLKDGVRCDNDSGLCNISYSAGTLYANVSSFSNYTTQAAPTSSCGFVNSNLALLNNVNSSGSCFNINASNVVLDCAGYNVTYSTSGSLGYGVNNSAGFDNITVKNCNLYEGNNITSYKHAIYFSGVDNGTIINNTITTVYDFADGIYLLSSSNLNISDNVIILSSSPFVDGYGLEISSTTNSTIQNNNITGGTMGIISQSSILTIDGNTFDINGYGINLGSSSSGSTITGNSINSSDHAFFITEASSNNVFTNNTVLESGGDAIRIDSSISTPINNNFTNNTFNNIVGYDLNILDSGNGTYLINQNIASYFINESIVNFKNTNYGLIEFSNLINGTGTNLSSDVQISNNSIFVNSTNNGGLNVSAQLEFYNLSYVSTPWLMKDGTRCDNSNICNISYSGSILYANVSSFSNYTTQEAADSAPTTTLVVPAANYINDTAAITEINFSCNATDDNQLVNISLYLTNSTNQSFVLNQTTNINGTSNSSSWSLNLTTGNYTWNCLAYDNASQSDWDTNRTITLNYTVDNFPTWSTNSTNIVSTYSSSTLSEFNITWADDNSVSIVYLESNYSGTATNYSMNNITASIYNYSVILPVGTHYWKSYANDSTNQWNETTQWNFTISQNTENCDVGFNETSPLTYPAAFQAYTNCTSAFILYRNGTSTTNNSVQSLAVGSYNFTVVRTDQSNYSSYYDEEIFTVAQTSSEVNTTINNSESNISLAAGSTIDLNCTLITGESDVYLYNNGTLINSGTSPLGNSTTFSSEGLYNITCLYQSTQNYSASSETYWVNVTQYPIVELVSPAASYTNDSAVIINVTFECNATDLTDLQNISLYLTDNANNNFALNQTTNITGTSNSSNWTLELGVGTYTWNCLSYDNLSESNWADVNRTIAQNYAVAVETPTGGSSGGGGGGSSVVCGDTVCAGGETCDSCPGDCGICPTEEVPEEVKEAPKEIGGTSEEVTEESVLSGEKAINEDLPLFGGAIALVPEFDIYLTYGVSFVLFVLLILVIIKVISLINKRRKIRKSTVIQKLFPEERITKDGEGPIVIQKGKHKKVKMDQPSLKDEYDIVNQKLLQLEQKLSQPEIKKEVKQKLKVNKYGIKELVLQRGLRKVDAKLHGYPARKPLVIKASEENIKLSKELDFVKNELTQPGKRIPKNIKVITRIPDRKKPYGNKFLDRELNKVTSTLANSTRDPGLLLRKIFPKKKVKSPEKLAVERKAQEEVIRISKKTEGKNPLPKNELQDVEEKLARLKQKLEK